MDIEFNSKYKKRAPYRIRAILNYQKTIGANYSEIAVGAQAWDRGAANPHAFARKRPNIMNADSLSCGECDCMRAIPDRPLRRCRSAEAKTAFDWLPISEFFREIHEDFPKVLAFDP